MKYEGIRKDYYKVVNCIKSSKTDEHFNACKRLIELFEDKNTFPVEFTFGWVDIYNFVRTLSNELYGFMEQQKVRNKVNNL